jgi:hypothetical protein
MECQVEQVLRLLLAAGKPFDYVAVRDLATPVTPQVPYLNSIPAPDLKLYDVLLQGVR